MNLERQCYDDKSFDDDGDCDPGRDQLGAVSQVVVQPARQVVRVHEIHRQPEINAFLRRMQRFGYLQCHITVAELMNKSDHDLFGKLCAPTHKLSTPTY